MQLNTEIRGKTHISGKAFNSCLADKDKRWVQHIMAYDFYPTTPLHICDTDMEVSSHRWTITQM